MGEANDRLLEVGERRAWLYVGRLSANTTNEKIKNFLVRKDFDQQKMICEELRTQGSNKAFKVGIPLNKLECTENPEFSEWTSSSVSIVLWNVEGLNSILHLNPPAFLTTDIVILAETFITQNMNIEGYYNSHLLATQGDRGRPSGGISRLLKPWLTPHKITYSSANILAIETKTLNIIGTYFQPNHSAQDIIEKMADMLKNIKQHIGTIVAGDFNCHIDKEELKSRTVIDYMEGERFVLENDPQDHTYIYVTTVRVRST